MLKNTEIMKLHEIILYFLMTFFIFYCLQYLYYYVIKEKECKIKKN